MTIGASRDSLIPRSGYDPSDVTYWYEGHCPRTGVWVGLPRTLQVEAIAHQLMADLSRDDRLYQEGKMVGVLLVNTPTGQQVLRAFSGSLGGQWHVPGWVPPIPGRNRVALAEAQTLAALTALRAELQHLQSLPERQIYAQHCQEFAEQLQAMAVVHAQRKQHRHNQRQQLASHLTPNTATMAALEEQSRQDGLERRRLKRQRTQVLQPLEVILQQADARIQALKQQRRQLSRQLQQQLHISTWLTNGNGEVQSLSQLWPQGLPTGTGECCAPKLLHYAASQGFQPVAMAEFWWGSPTREGDKQPGQFYGACAERCQPLMGFLLSGLQHESVTHVVPPDGLSTLESSKLPSIIYQDDYLIVVNKPSGLLSVPGRYPWEGSHVGHYLPRQPYYLHHQVPKLSGLEQDGEHYPDTDWLEPRIYPVAIHRLDQDTSGVLLLAKDLETERYLRQQFQQRRVIKHYDAVVHGVVQTEEGVIDLPLAPNWHCRPCQQVDREHGKPSLTRFRVVARSATTTRLVFQPVTGRTHQLRVHAADPRGLGTPIVGDRLYTSVHGTLLYDDYHGNAVGYDRLHLHARSLQFSHPHTGESLRLEVPAPF